MHAGRYEGGVPEPVAQTMGATPWRQEKGSKRRAVPQELRPCWKAAQIFIHWFRLRAEVGDRRPGLQQLRLS